MRTTGQLRLHSCLHFFGLHLSLETMAMRTSLSDMVAAPVIYAPRATERRRTHVRVLCHNDRGRTQKRGEERVAARSLPAACVPLRASRATWRAVRVSRIS